MRDNKLMRNATLVLSVAALAACSDSPSNGSLMAVPEPGTLVVALTAPRTDAGAVRFALRGEGIANVRAAGDAVEVYAMEGSDGWRVAVLGTALEGDLVRFDVPDVNQADRYQVQLLDVADGSNQLVRNPGDRGIGLAVRP